jgi:NAD+ diphosphatase
MAAFKYCPSCAAPLEDKIVEREPRRACSAACGYVHYDNPTPVIAAVVEHENQVVLARNRAWPRTFYGLITGFLERNESPQQCALREVREELGIEAVAPPALIGAYPFERMNQVIIAYHVSAAGTITLNEELDDYKHVPLERCRVWPAGTGLALRDWLRTRGYEPEMMQWI